MNLLAFLGNKKLLGVDIGTANIKIAELDSGPRGVLLTSFVMAPTPEGAISAGDIANSAIVAQAIQGLWEKLGTRQKKICTGLWGTSVIVKKVSMPKVDKKLISKQIMWEAEQYIPFDLSEIALDYQLLSSSSSSDLMDVLLVAAQNAQISELVSATKNAKLDPQIIDVNAFAFANCFEVNYGIRKNSTLGLLNLGATNTSFLVISNGEIVFSRDIPLGGATYTNEISKEMGLSYREAEALKVSASSSRDIPEQVQSIISNTNENLAEEVRTSLEFYNATPQVAPVEQFFYTGGASLTANLIQKIVQVVGINFNPINPFQKVKTGPRISREYAQQILPYISVAVGLGLRKVGDR